MGNERVEVMQGSPLSWKGASFTLTVVQLQDSDLAAIRTSLREKVKSSPLFFSQAPVVLNVASLPEEFDWLGVKLAVLECGMHLVGISGCDSQRKKDLVQLAGLPLITAGKEGPKNLPESRWDRGRLVLHPVRSGQQIYAHNSDLVVVGQVSPGAEVIADGHLHLYGVTRGRIIAGAGGDTSSRIFCSNLQAELIAISGRYWLSDQIPKEFWQAAVTVSWQEESLLIEALN